MSRPNLEIVSILNSKTIPFIAPNYCVATCTFQPETYAAIVFKVFDAERDPYTLCDEIAEQFIHLMTLDDQKARGIFDVHPDAPLFFEDVHIIQIIEGIPRVG
ncbi:hypothetical protein [Xanthomonas phage RTH11]|nr:hypothetical protein [Xanthomonas phage RTH11]